MPNRFGLAKGPECFPGGRVHGDHLSPRCRDRVQNTVDVNRGGSGEIIQIRAKIVATPNPGLLKLLKISSIDLVKRRKPGMTHVTTNVAPLAVFSTR